MWELLACYKHFWYTRDWGFFEKKNVFRHAEITKRKCKAQRKNNKSSEKNANKIMEHEEKQRIFPSKYSRRLKRHKEILSLFLGLDNDISKVLATC